MSTALITLTNNLASRLGMGECGEDVLPILKATAFKGPATDAQLTALMIVANQYGLNPWTKEIYAFPDKNNGIVPVVGVDGWARILNGNHYFDGMEFNQDEESCTCIIFRKDRNHPTSATEYMSECRRDTGPWKSHPKRMLRHKAMIQCSRLAFGFGGIYDQDEAERIAEIEINPIPKRQNGAQAAEAARPAIEQSPERDALIKELEGIAINIGAEAYTEKFKAIGKAGRLMVGSDEHARLWALANTPVNELPEPGASDE